MLVQHSKGMPKFVQDNAALLGSDRRLVTTDPSEVHCRLARWLCPDLLPDIRPRSVVLLECYTDIARVVRIFLNEGNVGPLLPLLDNLANLGLLDAVAFHDTS